MPALAQSLCRVLLGEEDSGGLTRPGFSVEAILPPGDCWQYLEIFLVVTTGGGGFTIGIYLVGCGQGCS